MKKTKNIVTFFKHSGRLYSDVLDTYNFLEDYNKVLAEEFIRKARGAERKIDVATRKQEMKHALKLVELDEKPQEKKSWFHRFFN